MKTYTITFILSISILFAQGITNTIGGNTADDKFIVENNNGDKLLTVTGEGYVGIGTDDPDYKFVIHDYSSSGMVLRNDHSGYTPNDGFAITFGGVYDEAWVWNYEEGPIIFGTNRSRRMTIGSNGRIGIGEIFPDAKFHLKGDDYPNTFMFLESNTDKDAGFRLIENGSAMWHIFNNGGSDSQLNIRNNSYQPCITINQDNGNVGIGTANPIGTLDINGKIYQRGLYIHADYVFEEDYELESITEHADFMWTNKHLPAIPKASIDENGNEIVEVGSHRKGIVEELEKAHIYITQLENRIAHLEQIIIKGN